MSFLLVRLAAAVLAIVLGSAAADAQDAQDAQIGFDTPAHDGTQPVEVVSERLSVDQTAGTAVFTGDVVVVQGEMRMSAEEVLVVYEEGDAGSGRIERMEASGGVLLVMADQAAEAQDAIYSLAAGTVVMTGDVLLTQGPNTISGQRLEVDLDTGTGVMEGRVRTVLQAGGSE